MTSGCLGLRAIYAGNQSPVVGVAAGLVKVYKQLGEKSEKQF